MRQSDSGNQDRPRAVLTLPFARVPRQDAIDPRSALGKNKPTSHADDLQLMDWGLQGPRRHSTLSWVTFALYIMVVAGCLFLLLRDIWQS